MSRSGSGLVYGTVCFYDSDLLGALDGGGGGPQCRLSILRNGNVPCRYFLNVPVDFKIV